MAIYKRVIIKLSGEALAGDKGFGIDESMLEYIVEQIKKVREENVEIGIAINKTLPLRMLADSPANSQNIEAFKNEDWVAVYENKAKGADGSQAFCVIGYEQGASMQNATLDKYGDGYNGGWGGDLIEQNAPTPQIFFDAGGIDASRAALEALCTPAE